MNMMRRWVIKAGLLFSVLLLCLAATTQAASFDCGKVKTLLEKTICNNPELSKLDEELNKVYAEALKKTSDPAGLKDWQRRWHKHWQDECGGMNLCIEHQWKSQIIRLGYVVNPTHHDYLDTVFAYELVENNDDTVCRHMLEVFNRDFKAPWANDPKPVKNMGAVGTIGPTTNSAYEANGKYAFPKLPGITHDVDMTFRMRQSRLPTSPEFDRIPWREGRRTSDQKLLSMLVADFDIDNDGHIETVLKTGFFGDLNVYSAHAGEDTYLIYPQGEIDPTKVVDLWILLGNDPGLPKPRKIDNMFMRPFVFNEKIYLTGYGQKYGILTPESQHVEIPDEEYMYVKLYRGGGQSLGKGQYTPVTMDIVCRYRMIATGSVDTSEKEK